jgi:hypothetical protein
MTLMGKQNPDKDYEDETNEEINAKLERMLGEAPQPILTAEQEKNPKHRIIYPRYSVLKQPMV